MNGSFLLGCYFTFYHFKSSMVARELSSCKNGVVLVGTSFMSSVTTSDSALLEHGGNLQLTMGRALGDVLRAADAGIFEAHLRNALTMPVYTRFGIFFPLLIVSDEKYNCATPYYQPMVKFMAYWHQKQLGRCHLR